MIFAHARRLAAVWLGALALACASVPKPTAAQRALAANPRAVVEGRVVDSRGLPVSGIAVYAIPRGKDIGWSPPSITDTDGRFRLSLFAPADYGFFLRWNGRTVITARRDDPSRLAVSLRAGERFEGVELRFLRDAWEQEEEQRPK